MLRSRIAEPMWRETAVAILSGPRSRMNLASPIAA